jgi:hypothetical protein
MRAIFLAVLFAAGIGFVGVSNVSAAPANGVAIGEGANQNSNVAQVQHWRWGSRGRYWRRCHRRGWSRSYRC